MIWSANRSNGAERSGGDRGRIGSLALVAATALLVGAASPLHAAPVGGRPKATATRPARQAQEIEAELNELSRALAEVTPSMDILFDPAKRKEFVPKALPLLNKMVGLYDELAATVPELKEPIQPIKMELTAIMYLVGDEPATQSLKAMTVSTDAAEATSARAWLLAGRWIAAGTDSALQEKMTAELRDLARLRPDQDMIAQVATLMAKRAASPALRDQMENVIIQNLKGVGAERMAAKIEGERKLRVLENKPLVLQGITADGKKFSSADWKGKVVLVDFWATFCPPCVAELPRMKKVYADHHAKGLEIVGISCDNDPSEHKAYLAENKDAPWTQLYDEKNPGWHPLAKQYNVEGLPAMFLIDKKGIVRSVAAFEDYAEMIPKLLAE